MKKTLILLQLTIFLMINQAFVRHRSSPPEPFSPVIISNATVPTKIGDGTSINYPPFYILPLQWPTSVCVNNEHVNCKAFIPDQFCIHGLWLVQEFHPCVGEELTMDQLRHRGREWLQNLRSFWPNLFYTPRRYDPDFSFWKRQWDVHGKCTGLPALDYFDSAVTKARHYINLLGETRRIIPSDQPHSFSFLYHMLQGVLRTQFRMKCNRAPNGKHQLQELRICLDRFMRPTHCLSPFNINCDSGEIFYFPPPVIGSQQ